MKVSEQKALDVEAIIERMRYVRSAGHSHASELQGEAQRLVDWKEYVLAKPLVSIAAASVFGFAIVRSTIRAISSTTPISYDAKIRPAKESSVVANVTNGAMALGASIVSSALKSYFANLVQRSLVERGSSD